jgi:Do/DeqQ family serine protease
MNAPRIVLARRAGLVVLAALLATVAVRQGWPTQTSAAPMPIAASSPVLAGNRTSYADVVKVAAPAVVTIRTEMRARVRPTAYEQDPFGGIFGGQPGNAPRREARPQRGLGSGVVVSSDGYILTNHHVIAGADQIKVEFTDRRVFVAKLVGSDEPSDLSLLKIDALNLPSLTLGDSDEVEVGDVVLAVGNPLGIGQTVTMGIVSAKGRSTVGDGSYEDFLQTDAPINQGNSGGALVNLQGRLVGINSQIVSTSQGNIGIGFAIPANMARHVMQALRAEGRVHRGQLGVRVEPVTSDLAESLGLASVSGAVVNAVERGGAAERAGLKAGDVILSFNGKPVEDFNALRNRVAESTPGSNASLVVVRDGKERSLTVRLDEAAYNPRS